MSIIYRAVSSPRRLWRRFPRRAGSCSSANGIRQLASSLLSLFVGQTVSVVTVNQANAEEIVRPTMLLRAQPKPLVELDGHVEAGPLGRIALPGLPLGTLHKPTLELDLEAPRTAT